MAGSDHADEVLMPRVALQQPNGDNSGVTGGEGLQTAKRTNDGAGQITNGSLEPLAYNNMLNGDNNVEEGISDRVLLIKTSDTMSFLVRWSECDTWEKLKSVLEKRLLSADEKTKQRIKYGKFVVRNSWRGNDSAFHDKFVHVPPEYWDTLPSSSPPIRLRVDLPVSFDEDPKTDMYTAEELQRLESITIPKSCSNDDIEDLGEEESGKTDKSHQSNPNDISYERKIRYTVGYYKKSHHSYEPDFLYSYSADDPVIDSLWNLPKFAPVLEEKVNVLYPQNRAVSRDLPEKRAQNDGQVPLGSQAVEPPKLEAGDLVGLPSVQIRSPLLLSALGTVIKYWSTIIRPENEPRIYRNEMPTNNSDNFRGGTFKYPFRDLYYHKEELLEYKEGKYPCSERHPEDYQRECGEHIDLLMDYLYAQPDIGLAAAEDGWRRKNPTTNFASFWLLMKPGTDVYVRKNGVLNAFVVDHIDGGITFSERGRALKTEPYTVRVWGMWFDGKVISRISIAVNVPVFDNEREILSLSLFPVRFQDDIDNYATRNALLKRGQKFFKCCKGPAYMEYTGAGFAGRSSKHTRARVVIDHFDRPWKDLDHNLGHKCEFVDDSQKQNNNGFYCPWGLRVAKDPPPGSNARSPRCECKHCMSVVDGGASYPPETHSDYDNIVPSETEELTEHQYLLCWDQMFGFILKDRNYDLLNVENLIEPQLSDDAIESLVLKPESNKDAIKALVKTYTEQTSDSNLFSADFIQNKGEGQVILLHGPPGTGKTLTAESVAEFTRKPLVSITAADLGHEPQDLERNLTRFLKNAHIWNAVVLLDEADVYLQRRSVHDLKRNSIVSIFLRLLDYFQGILFLTSNRVGHIDEAFMSRIHIALGYKPLDDDARSCIWDNLFRKIQDDHSRGGPKIKYEYDAKQFVKKNDELKALQWNGREIRNAFQTVVALATSDAKKAAEKKGESVDQVVPEIREGHFRKVVQMSAAFRSYMTSTHEGMEDPDHAFRLGNRDDRFYQE